MGGQIDYYLSLQSPWTWLGHDRLMHLADRFGLAVNYRVVDFGAIFAQSGGLPLPKRAPQRQAYRLVELERWRKSLGIDLNIHPAHFPVPESLAAHVVTAASLENPNVGVLAGAILRAVWVEDRNIADEVALQQIIEEVGLDAGTLLKAALTAETEDAWQKNTTLAIEAGVFGAPTYVLDGELFWGQDRLGLLEEKLKAS
jgi:2-hydroxychromene-2-carboxylate isomerase